jgi:hypothetical protein
MLYQKASQIEYHDFENDPALDEPSIIRLRSCINLCALHTAYSILPGAMGKTSSIKLITYVSTSPRSITMRLAADVELRTNPTRIHYCQVFDLLRLRMIGCHRSPINCWQA